jgi:hypothetical protein
MDTPIIVAIISAVAITVVPALTFYFTKKKEREADWQKYKFEHYREFVTALSGIVDTDSPPEGHRRFTVSTNTLQLLASKAVMDALHEFRREIAASNPNRTEEKHDRLLSKLIWEIRTDLKMPGTPPIDEFAAVLWCSGANDRTDQRSAPGKQKAPGRSRGLMSNN